MRRTRTRLWPYIDHHDSPSLIDEVEDTGTNSQIPPESVDGQPYEPMAS
jgi:hypothetical protein